MSSIINKLPIDIKTIKGFLADDEGQALFEAAYHTAHLGPSLEVGSYCGKSTVYLGTAAKQKNNIIYAIDHHRGSEEHQLGEEYHDSELFDSQAQLMDTFKAFRKTMRDAELEDTVIPIVASSQLASRNWSTPLGMVFIDGVNSLQAEMKDYRAWAGHIAIGGLLAIHDIFPDPKDGGQAPYTIWKLAKASGLFEELPTVNTLGLFKRI